jgi:hypothetical protein
LLSVIVIYDEPAHTERLDEALFALAVQDWEELELIMVTRAADDVYLWELERLVLEQPWAARPTVQLLSIQATFDCALASELANLGGKHASGRYVAFMYYRDLIYQHAYVALIGRLRETDAVAAVGGCRIANHDRGTQHWYVTDKEKCARPPCRFDLLVDDCVPLHAFVLDRFRLGGHIPRFEASADLSAYLFLLNLCERYEVDFALTGQPMCEYRRAPVPAASAGRPFPLRASRARLIHERLATTAAGFYPPVRYAELAQLMNSLPALYPKSK